MCSRKCVNNMSYESSYTSTVTVSQIASKLGGQMTDQQIEAVALRGSASNKENITSEIGGRTVGCRNGLRKEGLKLFLAVKQSTVDATRIR